jgi:two-component system NtrC family sensor kinase
MYRKLSFKVAVPLAIAVTAVSIAISEAGSHFRRGTTTRLTTERAHSLLALTLKTVNAVTPDGHRPDLQPFLDELVKDPDVMTVRILNREGIVKRSASRSDAGPIRGVFDESRRSDSPGSEHRVVQLGRATILRTIEDIPNQASCKTCHGEAKSLGQIFLVLTIPNQSESELRWFVDLATGGVQTLTLVLLTGLIVSVLVSRPVGHLASAMAQVQRGNLDVEVQPVGTREIDTIVSGFNSMVRRLRDARRTEAEVQRLAMERAEHLAAVGEMAAGLAHEIRNPVAGVKAAVEVMAGQMPHDDMRRQIMRESVSELDRVDRVIKDLLDYARPRAPVLAAVDLGQVARSAWTLTSAGAAAKGVECLWLLPPVLPPVQADVAMIRQVVINLIINALQALAGADEQKIQISAEAGPSEVVVSVLDFGPGLNASTAENIFRPFFTTKPRGTGLGLSISRRIIEMHGGRLWVENAGQPHADLRFSLPLASRADVSGEPGASGTRRGDPEARGSR